MTEIFEAKLRQIGNSLGVIVPNELITEKGYRKGDIVTIAIPSMDLEQRNRKLGHLAGKFAAKHSFVRETEDRF